MENNEEMNGIEDMLQALRDEVAALRATQTVPAPPPESLTFEGEPDAVAALLEALAEAQGAFDQPKKTTHVHVETKKGPYDFDYAPLEEIIRATRIALAKQKIAVWQPVTRESREKWVLHTILSGHGARVVATIPFSPQYPTDYDGNTREDPKALGSLITYYRRYAMASMLGVAADDDDDAGAATGDKTTKQQSSKTRSKRAPSTSETAKESKQREEPPPKAPAPKDGPGITRETMQALIDVFGEMGLNGMKKAEVCQEVTGKPLNALDEESGQKLLAHLRGGR